MRNGLEKALHRNKTKKNIPIRLAAVLLCMTLLSTYCVSGLYARYTVSGRSGDSARVAKFSIEGEGVLTEQIEESFVPGSSLEKSLSIHNNSEVAVEYTIAVTNATNNLPLLIRVTNTGTPDEVKEGNNIAFTKQQLPGDHTDNYTLYICWPADDKDPAPMGMVDYITVTVTAAQID